jgi:hypothetical protein
MNNIGITTEAAYIAAARQAAKEKLGAKWLLHPANRINRLPEKQTTEVQHRLVLSVK